MSKDEQNNLLDSVSAILIRCFFLSFALLLISFIFYFAGRRMGLSYPFKMVCIEQA